MMLTLNHLIHKLIDLRSDGVQITLLAACPNSAAVLEAAVLCAARQRTPMLFAATLNQVDTDGGYTTWTPADFVQQMRAYARQYACHDFLYPCLDHGGPWLKDIHTLRRLSLEETLQAVKTSLTACLQAGYQLLHIDPTVDRSLPPGAPLPVETVVARTIELVAHAEAERARLGLPPIAYEVGSEEVHGGLVDLSNFTRFLSLLRQGLEERNLSHAWPCFIVAQVGTDLHTTFFDPAAAQRIHDLVVPFGSLAKGHYSDWVENPEAYPLAGMGGANVGPEFTAEEVLALQDLAAREEQLHPAQPSHFMRALEDAVVASGRWQKWLQADEKGKDFAQLSAPRRLWLLQTGARYIWTAPEVVAARRQIYANLRPVLPDAHAHVVERIARRMERYVQAFNLRNFIDRL
jgi:D-tagatose-1,6-bisphosphate aldolase subunit GatZ/KbaZ